MKKILLPFISIVFSCFFIISCGGGTKASSLKLEGEPVLALNSMAQKNLTVSGTSSGMYFKFTSDQIKKLYSRIQATNGSVSLCLNVEKVLDKINLDSQDFSFGFLTEDDFDKNGRIYSGLESRYLITGSLSDFNQGITLEYAITEDAFGERLPVGFFFSSQTPCSIKSIGFIESRFGFDFNENVPVFAFGGKGGKVASEISSIDFSDAKSIFINSKCKKIIGPYAVVGLSKINDIGTYDAQKSAYLKFGNEKIRIRRTLNSNEAVIQSDALENVYSLCDFSSSTKQIVSLMLYENKISNSEDSKILEPIPSDLGMILDWNQNNWRGKEYELFKWNLFPEVLFFDFSDYAIQSQFLTRMAYFVEKEGYKGTFISDADVISKHGYNAHDYKAVDLANFFTQAYVQNFKLNKRELLLRDILVQNGIIIPKGDGTFVKGKGCIISIARESNDALRYKLIAHEAWHGVFFGDADFRKFIDDVYDNFDEQSLTYIKRYWTCTKDLSYDLNDDYLMRNEFMAYIMQQNLASLQQYIVTRSGWRNKVDSDYDLVEYVKENNAEYFYEAGVKINDYVFKRWGFSAGRLSLITKQ